MTLQFNHNNKIFNIEINKKKIKNIYIKLNSKNNIIISAPLLTSDQFIQEFINKHLDKFIRIQNNNANKKNIDLDNKSFYLFGRLEYFDIISKVSSTSNQINNFLVFEDKQWKINKKSIPDLIQNIYKKELMKYLLERQQEKEQLMNIDNHKIVVRIKFGAWATNYTTKKQINYSTKLAAFSKEIIDYVIIHELAHAKQANHSSKFWEIVTQYEPDFKIKKNKLKSFNYF